MARQYKSIKIAVEDLQKKLEDLEPTQLHRLMMKTTRAVLSKTAKKVASQAAQMINVDEKRFARALRRGTYSELTGGFVSTRAGNGRYSKRGQYLTRHGDMKATQRYKPIPMWMIGSSGEERRTGQGIGRKPHVTGVLEPRDYLTNASQLESEALTLLNDELKRQVKKIIKKAKQ